jgi:hypothetical protein
VAGIIAYICLQGTKGTLYLPDPNQFGGDVVFSEGLLDPRQIRNQSSAKDVILPPVNDFTTDCRGIGVAEMAFATEQKIITKIIITTCCWVCFPFGDLKRFRNVNPEWAGTIC